MSWSCTKHGWSHLFDPCPICNAGVTVVSSTSSLLNPSQNQEGTIRISDKQYLYPKYETRYMFWRGNAAKLRDAILLWFGFRWKMK